MLLKPEKEHGEKTVLIFKRCSVNDSLKSVLCDFYCGHSCPVGRRVPLLHYMYTYDISYNQQRKCLSNDLRFITFSVL